MIISPSINVVLDYDGKKARLTATGGGEYNYYVFFGINSKGVTFTSQQYTQETFIDFSPDLSEIWKFKTVAYDVVSNVSSDWSNQYVFTGKTTPVITENLNVLNLQFYFYGSYFFIPSKFEIKSNGQVLKSSKFNGSNWVDVYTNQIVSWLFLSQSFDDITIHKSFDFEFSQNLPFGNYTFDISYINSLDLENGGTFDSATHYKLLPAIYSKLEQTKTPTINYKKVNLQERYYLVRPYEFNSSLEKVFLFKNGILFKTSVLNGSLFLDEGTSNISNWISKVDSNIEMFFYENASYSIKTKNINKTTSDFSNVIEFQKKEVSPFVINVGDLMWFHTKTINLLNSNSVCNNGSTTFEIQSFKNCIPEINQNTLTIQPINGIIADFEIEYIKKCNGINIGKSFVVGKIIQYLTTVETIYTFSTNYGSALNDEIPFVESDVVLEQKDFTQFGTLILRNDGSFSYLDNKVEDFEKIDFFSFYIKKQNVKISNLVTVIINLNPNKTMFYSTEQISTKRKNDCLTGYFSNYLFTYTVSAGMFKSQISQQDANNQAKAFADQQAQLNANMIGTCELYIPTLVGNDFFQHVFYSSRCDALSKPIPYIFTLETDSFYGNSKEEANYLALRYMYLAGQNLADSENKCSIEDAVKELKFQMDYYKKMYEGCKNIQSQTNTNEH